MGKLAERPRRRKKLKGHGQIGRAGGPKERDSEDAGQCQRGGNTWREGGTTCSPYTALAAPLLPSIVSSGPCGLLLVTLSIN